MSIPKGPTEGGSGGKKGHSNAERWGTHQEVKAAAKRLRRLDSKSVVREEASTPPDLESEANELTALLKSKRVRVVWRHRPGEFAIEFTDGTRMGVQRLVKPESQHRSSR